MRPKKRHGSNLKKNWLIKKPKIAKIERKKAQYKYENLLRAVDDYRNGRLNLIEVAEMYGSTINDLRL